MGAVAGFSLAGLLISLALLAPSLLFARDLREHAGVPGRVPPVLGLIERVGQVGCLVLAPLSGGAGRGAAWGVVVGVLVAGYYALWARYLAGGRRVEALYAPLGPVPVPMALLPVLAFLTTAYWVGSWPLALAAVVLAAGHLPVAWRSARTAA